MLPVRETYFPHNLVDIVHDALDDDVCSVTLCLVEEFGERFFGLNAFFFRVDFPLGLDHIPGHLKNSLQELKAGEETLFMALPDLLQSLTQRDECRSAAPRAAGQDRSASGDAFRFYVHIDSTPNFFHPFKPFSLEFPPVLWS